MPPTPSVPDMEFDLTGTTYGGAYWNPAEYRVRFAAQPGGTVHVTAETELGHVVAEQHLPDAAVAAALDALRDGGDTPLPGPAGLTRETHWRLGDDEYHALDLHPQIDQVREWLTYATGEQRWDPADTEWYY